MIKLKSDKADHVRIARALGAIPSIIESSNQDEADKNRLTEILTFFTPTHTHTREQIMCTPYWMMKKMFRILEGATILESGKTLGQSLNSIQHVRIVNEREVNNTDIKHTATNPAHLIYLPSNFETCNELNHCTWPHEYPYYHDRYYGIKGVLIRKSDGTFYTVKAVTAAGEIVFIIVSLRKKWSDFFGSLGRFR